MLRRALQLRKAVPMPVSVLGQIMPVVVLMRDRVHMCATVVGVGKGVRMQVGVASFQRIIQD